MNSSKEGQESRIIGVTHYAEPFQLATLSSEIPFSSPSSWMAGGNSCASTAFLLLFQFQLVLASLMFVLTHKKVTDPGMTVLSGTMALHIGNIGIAAL